MAKRIKIDYAGYIVSLASSDNPHDLKCYMRWLNYVDRSNRTLNQTAYAFCKREGLILKAKLFTYPEILKIVQTKWLDV